MKSRYSGVIERTGLENDSLICWDPCLIAKRNLYGIKIQSGWDYKMEKGTSLQSLGPSHKGMYKIV